MPSFTHRSVPSEACKGRQDMAWLIHPVKSLQMSGYSFIPNHICSELLFPTVDSWQQIWFWSDQAREEVDMPGLYPAARVRCKEIAVMSDCLAGRQGHPGATHVRNVQHSARGNLRIVRCYSAPRDEPMLTLAVSVGCCRLPVTGPLKSFHDCGPVLLHVSLHVEI